LINESNKKIVFSTVLKERKNKRATCIKKNGVSFKPGLNDTPQIT